MRYRDGRLSDWEFSAFSEILPTLGFKLYSQVDIHNFRRISMSFRFFPRKSSPKVLDPDADDDLKSLAKYMGSDSCRNVFLMVIPSLLLHAFYGIEVVIVVRRR